MLILRQKTTLVNKTGGWRTFVPKFYKEKCIDCGSCHLYCPDSAIKRISEREYEINLDYCKGCGICSNECPTKAIEMILEEK